MFNESSIVQGQYWFWSIFLSFISIVASSIVAIIVILLSSRFNKSLKILELDSKKIDRITDLRAKLFDSVKGDINVVFIGCYLVGDWRKISNPRELLDAKRRADREMVESLPIWGSEIMKAYKEFIDICFETKRGRNMSPLLRADRERYKEECKCYSTEWNDYFMSPESKVEWLQGISKCNGHISYRNDVLFPSFVRLNHAFSHAMGTNLTMEDIRVALGEE